MGIAVMGSPRQLRPGSQLPQHLREQDWTPSTSQALGAWLQSRRVGVQQMQLRLLVIMTLR